MLPKDLFTQEEILKFYDMLFGWLGHNTWWIALILVLGFMLLAIRLTLKRNKK